MNILLIALIFSFVLSEASTDENTLLIVNKMEEEGFDSSPWELEAAEILNPMLYRRTYSTKFDCLFNLRSYPFDTQE